MRTDLVRTRRRLRTANACPEAVEDSTGECRRSRATVESPRSRRGELIAGRYRVMRRLGRGGMASVWLALDNQLARPVALKELATEGAALREARAASAVCHPGVVQVYGVFCDGGREWIVMEALSGMTLRRSLREGGPLPAAQVVPLGISLLQALETVHRAGLVHGDVKPGNVQILSTGSPVLIDFGLASEALWASPETPFVAGSPPYMAPEVIRSGVREGASDLFSLGASLYEAATGRRPFEGATPVETAEAVLHSDPEPALPGSAVGRVIEGLLVKDSRHRIRAVEAQTYLRESRARSFGRPPVRDAVAAQPA